VRFTVKSQKVKGQRSKKSKAKLRPALFGAVCRKFGGSWTGDAIDGELVTGSGRRAMFASRALRRAHWVITGELPLAGSEKNKAAKK
jgi:hypothetical protein